MSGPTYERAKEVVASGNRKLIDEMNRTGKVNGATAPGKNAPGEIQGQRA
jgi:hypothetical protein